RGSASSGAVTSCVSGPTPAAGSSVWSGSTTCEGARIGWRSFSGISHFANSRSPVRLPRSFRAGAAALPGCVRSPRALWFPRAPLVGLVTLDSGGWVSAAWLGLPAGWTAMIPTRMVLEYSGERFRVPLRAPAWLERNQVLLFGSATVPLLGTLLYSTAEPFSV